MSSQLLPSSNASADSHIMLPLLLYLVLPPAGHHHPLIGIADCCVYQLPSCHCSLCSHLQSMLHHCLDNCPLPLLAIVILPTASTVLVSHWPSPPLLPSPLPSSSLLYQVLFDCYVVICCPSSVVRCPSSVIHCQLFVVSCPLSIIHSRVVSPSATFPPQDHCHRCCWS